MLSKLIFTGKTVDSSDLVKSVSLEQNINSDTDYQIGVAGSAQIKFSTSLDYRPAVGAQFTLQMKQIYDTGFRTIGVFNVYSSEKTQGKIDVIAYDNISLLDKNVDSWLDSLTFPMSLTNFKNSLASYCGVTINFGTNITNTNYTVQDNFTSTGLTGRSVLQYICQLCGGFAKCNSSGQIVIQGYQNTSTNLTTADFKIATIAEYSVAKIDRVQVNLADDDIGVVVGTGTNALVIQNNPLLYAETDSEIRTQVTNIYNLVKDITYTPTKIEMLGDKGIEVGQIITVNGATTYIMQKSLTPSGVTLTCTGNPTRDQSSDSLNEEINALRGKYNKLTRTVEETVSELGDAQGDITQLKQTATSLQTQVTAADGKATEAKQTADGFSTRITNVEGEVSSVEQTMNGVVITTSQGRTYINGANILAGSIDLSGQIDWSDLTQDAQETIEGLAGDYGDSDVRALLNSTYNITHTQADGTQLASPTIVAGKILGAEMYAGSGNDGYVKMDSTGIDLYTTAGRKAVVGIGYLSSNYEYPFIIFGRGVDGQGQNSGMIKKYANGIWIGDNDGQSSSSVGSGDGVFVNFSDHNTYIYRNGSSSLVGQAVFI